MYPEVLLQPDETPCDDGEQTETLSPAQAAQAALQAEINRARAELDEARKDIEEARREAEAIRDQAHTDADDVREKARQEGYNTGLEDSRQEYEKVLERERQEFARSLQTLAHAKTEMFEQMEPAVLDLAMHAAEKIVKESLQRDDTVFMNIVKDTIKEVEDCEEIVLRVNKKEYDRFFSDDMHDYADLLKSSGVDIRPDMTVDSGECIVETEYGTLRSGVQTQLERMRHALESANSA